MVVRSTGMAAALSVVVMGWCTPALAQTALRDVFGTRPAAGRAAAPPVAKYVAGDEHEFILDRSGPSPLLKFEDNPEVWALRPSPGPRGDVIYRDDTGRPVVRATRLGGMTVFTGDRPGGMPAALSGAEGALKPSALSPAALFRHMAQASVRVKQAVGRLIVFDAPEVTPATSALYADAATLTAVAFARLSRRRDAARVFSGLRSVRFQTGDRPDVAVSGGQVEITLSPRHGLAGRPSSQRIANAVVESRR